MARSLTVSFGGSHPAIVTSTREMSWQDYVNYLVKVVPETDDKASRGWSCPVRFSPPYRDSENFVERYALTFDYDHITPADLEEIRTAYAGFAHLEYTTWSHTEEAPRWRFVFPLARPVTYDEFQAISRKVADYAGIELAARESHTPAQMMFLPTVRPGATIERLLVKGPWVDPDAVLAEYENWTDRTSWPHRREGDGVGLANLSVDPREKPGMIGAFCRAYTVPDAIVKFDLPYTPTSNPDRWTYRDGTRPEGFIVYDDGLKGHSHHDSDPARGQHNAFDLVRLHRFGYLDTDADLEKAVTERASYAAMADLVASDAAVQAAAASEEFDVLDDTPAPVKPAEAAEPPLARPLGDVLAHPTKPRWLIRDVLERGTIVLLAGPRGSYKSFLALDWGMRVAARDEPVYVVSAEGGDFDRRAAAWLQENTFDVDTPPLFVVERRLDLNCKEGIERIRHDCVKLGIRPRLFILDTFSKLSGGLDENSNSDVKQFIGRVDNGLKRAFDATVLIVAHTGHSDVTRARGASALEADTEAAHIVTRDNVVGTVLVTRERFKSSPELAPLVYKPKVVDLGRVDEEGIGITSVVLEPQDGGGLPVRGRKLGKNQKVMYETMREIGADGNPVSVGALLDAAVDKIPQDPEVRDTRRQKMQVALEGLIADGMLFKQGDSISMIRAVRVGEEDFQ